MTTSSDEVEGRGEAEQFYDDEIAPALRALAARCRERGLSIVAMVEWAPGETGRTIGLLPGSGLGIRIAELAMQANNNVDGLIMALMKYGREHGHNSACLHLLGVPTSPAEGGPSPPLPEER